MVLAEDLRQGALQGKLNRQLETDSSVDDMLKNIQVEKEKKRNLYQKLKKKRFYLIYQKIGDG